MSNSWLKAAASPPPGLGLGAETSDFLVRAWQEGVFGVSYTAVLLASGILILALLLRGVFARWVVTAVRAAARQSDSRIDDALVEALSEPMKLLFLIVGLDLAVRTLQLAPSADLAAERLVRSLIAVAVFWALHRLAGSGRTLMEPLAALLTQAAVDWLVRILQIIFLVVGVAAVLEIWGVRVGPLLAGLGIFGVAVALGAQDLFKNLIGGLLVLAEKRFEVGDWIKVDGLVEGTVEEIHFRSTTIRRFDKSPVQVPNSLLAENALVNFSRMSSRRIFWMINLEYGTRIDQLGYVRDEIEAFILTDPAFMSPAEASTFVRIDKLSDSSIDLLVYCFTRTTNWGEWLLVKERLALEIMAITAKAGASFAFPSQTLYHRAAADAPEPFRPLAPSDRRARMMAAQDQRTGEEAGGE